MSVRSNYDKRPSIRAPVTETCAWQGWLAIIERLRDEISHEARRIAVECYPGVDEVELAELLARSLGAASKICTRDFLKPDKEILEMTARDLTDDPVFGRMNGFTIRDFVDPGRVQELRECLPPPNAVGIVVGIGTELILPEPDLLIYADLPRWEIQLRQRAGKIGNLGLDNREERPSLKYKRAYFLDWRVADRIKRETLPKADYLVDTTELGGPKLVTGEAFRSALRHTVTRPFRVVPFFDPGPWGGQWMRRVCELPDGPPNYAWCFDCVPEENSLLLDFNGVGIEIPAIDLVFAHPRELLGDAVHARFGAEFPIRFDFLDTMGGGNLSLQVHPLTEYIQDKFGMSYTQDESYYLLDAAPDACVYLGVREGIDRCAMARELAAAQNGGGFDAEKHVNCWPAVKHDHFLIPAGTIHCSGKNSMVLEISATPYIFTFKLWDWGRLGLDGRPRPIHLEQGLANIDWSRDADWVQKNLIRQARTVAEGDGWREERTGLHAREFIETRRHWFSTPVDHSPDGVSVLNLVEGAEAVVESPGQTFEPFDVHYAETFIVPATAGRFTIRPLNGERCATVRATVRTNP